MSTQQSEDGGQVNARGREAPKPTLMKSYAAVSDDDLQAVVGKIRRITRTANARGAAPVGATPETEPAPAPIDQSLDHPIDESVDHPVDQSLDQSTTQSTRWPNDWPNEKPHTTSNDTSNETSNEPSNGSSDETDPQAPAPKPVVFSHNQAVLYQCIHWLQGRITSLQRIGQATGISAFTLKHCLHKLRKVGAVEYHGRKNTGGRIGFSAVALPCVVVLRGDEHLLVRRLRDIKRDQLSVARPIDATGTTIGHAGGPMDGLMTGLMDGLMGGLMGSPMESVPCSSSKEQLLQGLVLEDAFQSLSPRSLLAHLDQFNTTEELQDFIDMVNACIAASRRTDSPIRNPQGFLIAQLKAGYVNPPEGYKSRRVRALEKRNRLLEAELEEITRLKAEAERLELSVFRARLSPSDQGRLAREARDRLSPRNPLSESRQIEMAETDILRDWLAASRAEDGDAPGP